MSNLGDYIKAYVKEGSSPIFDIRFSSGVVERLKILNFDPESAFLPTENQFGKQEAKAVPLIESINFVGYFQRHPELAKPLGTKDNPDERVTSNIRGDRTDGKRINQETVQPSSEGETTAELGEGSEEKEEEL